MEHSLCFHEFLLYLWPGHSHAIVWGNVVCLWPSHGLTCQRKVMWPNTLFLLQVSWKCRVHPLQIAVRAIQGLAFPWGFAYGWACSSIRL